MSKRPNSSTMGDGDLHWNHVGSNSTLLSPSPRLHSLFSTKHNLTNGALWRRYKSMIGILAVRHARKFEGSSLFETASSSQHRPAAHDSALRPAPWLFKKLMLALDSSMISISRWIYIYITSSSRVLTWGGSCFVPLEARRVPYPALSLYALGRNIRMGAERCPPSQAYPSSCGVLIKNLTQHTSQQYTARCYWSPRLASRTNILFPLSANSIL